MKLKVGFSRPKKLSPLSWLIFKAQDWNKASHCYLTFFDKRIQQEVVFHATWPRAQLLTKKEFLKKNIVYEELEIELDGKIKRKTWALIYNTINKPYSFYQLLLTAFRLITGRTSSDKVDGAYICSEVVGLVLLWKGLVTEKQIETLTIKDVYNLCKNK